jgi:antitoxin component HigA of HigAB toxin-antitoxin module
MSRYIPVKPKQDGVRRWLRKHGRTQGWLAAQLGVSRSLISLILSRRRVPTLKLAFQIQERTGVSAQSFTRNQSAPPKTKGATKRETSPPP